MRKERKFVINLPERQPIAGNPYSVEEVDEVFGGSAGCDKGQKRIVVEQGAPSEWERMLRYAHECIHGGEEEYGFGPLKDDSDDSDVDRLAHLFTEMLFAIVEAQ
uniref:Uncharacterized protein n=1 Tax=viral metagenome TaxID=1070528 RepID=A0A6H2A0F7_9ZZZZ